MKNWKKSLKEKEIFFKNVRVAYWEKFGSLPSVSELTKSSWQLPNTKRTEVI